MDVPMERLTALNTALLRGGKISGLYKEMLEAHIANGNFAL